ncbi:MAG: class I SAM-dependent methyltransferase [Candidatus Marsarchaeota archaeon]|nr:class I SAM-dependent methyltransferase [Candidatus Marsarchaeota archaeon]MCL5101789.1 class I SAM-dependent methyltransferase [Candidatus Marsarchaeota archaeon]
MIKDIRKLYSTYWEHESERLRQDPYHSLEFETTFMFLDKYLPKNGLLLDAGGGTGVYSIELAKLGYRTVLLDYSKENIEMAKKEIRATKTSDRIEPTVGDIRDLSRFKDGSFDAVICLGGPLSLIYGKQNRRKAIAELVRVARPGATIFVSVMNKYGSIMLAPNKWPEEIATKNFTSIATTGDDRMWMGKYYCHYFSPKEIVDEFGIAAKKAKIMKLAALEGLATPSIDAINKLGNNRKAWRNWMAMHYKMCTDPEVVGVSIHMLLVARKEKIT